MRENWQDRDKLQDLVVEIQDHAIHLLDIALPVPEQAHLLRICEAAQTLLAMLGHQETAQESARDQTVPPKLPDNASVAHRSLNILLVEDNPFTQKLMIHLLTHRNHTVAVANHGKEALDLLAGTLTDIPGQSSKPTMFDLILMDVRMPVMDGLETVAIIRQWESKNRQQTSFDGELRNRQNLPIIAVTALISDADRERAFQVGVDGFHHKPLHAEQLFSEIDRLVSSSSTTKTEHANVHTPTTRKENTVNNPLDIGPLLKTVENDWSLLSEIVELYCADAPKHLQQIRAGIEKNNALLVQDAAHALKGASTAFGKTEAYTLALHMEQLGRSKALGQAKKILEPLQHAVAFLEELLRQELDNHNRLDQCNRSLSPQGE